jgi:hypothetical protein
MNTPRPTTPEQKGEEREERNDRPAHMGETEGRLREGSGTDNKSSVEGNTKRVNGAFT